jgi:site-specific DNA-methyltransferase (adenine-specific)
MSDKAVLLQGDCLEILKELPDNSVDSLITDPPAGISFMGKAWDEDKGGRKQWIAWMAEVMTECLRVLKPGAHGLVWAIPRTSHWTATALEDAGFEIRDVVTHLFGSGFPKSHNIEKATGDERFKGFGTALKPASEHWILVRKPIAEKTVAANVLKHGTGGINIDVSRISLKPGEVTHGSGANQGNEVYGEYSETRIGVPNITSTQGRFPANFILSHNPDCEETCTEGCAVAELDRQSGNLTSGKPSGKKNIGNGYHGNFGEIPVTGFGDSGGASRFFYCSKASKKDKGTDNTHPTVKSSTLMSYLIKLVTPPNGVVLDPFTGSGSTGVAAVKEGFDFIGIEKEEEYYTIAEKRVG